MPSNYKPRWESQGGARQRRHGTRLMIMIKFLEFEIMFRCCGGARNFNGRTASSAHRRARRRRCRLSVPPPLGSLSETRERALLNMLSIVWPARLRGTRWRTGAGVDRQCRGVAKGVLAGASHVGGRWVFKNSLGSVATSVRRSDIEERLDTTVKGRSEFALARGSPATPGGTLSSATAHR